MASHRYLTADVFTDTPFGGNQLAVFPDARLIPEERLQDVAREFNYSETTFVYPSETQEGTRRVRIFTPGAELPFAGHPTIGTAHVLAAIGELISSGSEIHVVLDELVGPVPVTITMRDGQPIFAQLSVAKLPELGPPAPNREALARVLGLDVDDFLPDPWIPQGYSCGLPFLFVPVRNRGAVARAQVRLDVWETTLKGTWASEIHLFAQDAERPGSDIRARVFVPGLSVPEDPATGSANAALAGYLAARDSRRDGTLRWRVEQGFEMGRPSILDVEADLHGGIVTAVRVGGSSVLVCDGMMEIA